MLKLHYCWLWIVFVWDIILRISWDAGNVANSLIATVEWEFHNRLFFVIYTTYDWLEFVTHIASVIVFIIVCVNVVEWYYFLLRFYLSSTIFITVIIVVITILILRMILPHQLFQRLEYPLTRCLLLKPQHILLILIHQPKTQPSLILQILLTDLQQPYPKLIIICLLIRFLLYVQKGRIATYVTFRP